MTISNNTVEITVVGDIDVTYTTKHTDKFNICVYDEKTGKEKSAREIKDEAMRNWYDKNIEKYSHSGQVKAYDKETNNVLVEDISTRERHEEVGFL